MQRAGATSIAQSATLYNEQREVHVVYAGEARGPMCKREMKLKIYERALDNNEREFRAELSCPSDDDFVYAGGVTKASFPRLVEQFTLTVDFENFAQRLIAQLSPSSPLDVYCVLSDDKARCTLQICRPCDIQRCSLPLELRALQGEELLAYLKGALRAQRKTAKVHLEARERAEEEISQLKEEVARRRTVEEENERLRERLEEESEAAEDNKIDLNEWKAKWEAAEGEMRGLREENGDLVEDLDEAIDEKEEMERRVEEMRVEMEEMEAKVEELEGRLRSEERRVREANSEISSLTRKLKRAKEENRAGELMEYVKKHETPIQSCDERKLRELEEDLKEKEELMEEMRERMEGVTKQLGESEQARALLEDANRQLQVEVQRMQKLVDVYRRHPGSTATPPVIYSATSPMYSPSPLAYSTPPTMPTVSTVPNHTTPSTARLPPLGRLDLQQRQPLVALNKPMTPANPARPLTGMLSIPASPKVLSYTGVTRTNARSGNNS